MFLNAILTNAEVWYNLTKSEIEELEENLLSQRSPLFRNWSHSHWSFNKIKKGKLPPLFGQGS